MKIYIWKKIIMKKFHYLFIVLLIFQVSNAQDSATKISMVDANWSLPMDAEFERFDNRETLLLKGGRALVKDQNFSNGTIEVDVYANSTRSFAGITFRKHNDNMEEVYMRMHKSNQADAVQYTPIFNNESNWQLYHEYQAQVPFKNSGWNTLRIDVNNKRAEVFVNDEKVLSIDKLRIDYNQGGIGLFSLFTNRFSNFRITHKAAIKDTVQIENKSINPDIITRWKITQARPYNNDTICFDYFLKEEYLNVETEESGLLPFSKYIKKSSAGNFEENQEDYSIASTTIQVDNNETRLFSFDYSDQIIVYLNGKAVFKGDNSFRSKGVQYMGHMDINANQLFLPLEKGENIIHCVVIDKANGWGLIAKLE